MNEAIAQYYTIYPDDILAIRLTARMEWQIEMILNVKTKEEKVNWKKEGF